MCRPVCDFYFASFGVYKNHLSGRQEKHQTEEELLAKRPSAGVAGWHVLHRTPVPITNNGFLHTCCLGKLHPDTFSLLVSIVVLVKEAQKPESGCPFRGGARETFNVQV